MSLTVEQKEARRHFVGASEVASLVGLCESPAPVDILQSKLGVDTFEGNEFTELGDALEEPIAQLWARRNGVVIQRHAIAKHPRFKYVGASPDFVSRDGDGFVNVEVKTAGRWAASDFGEPMTDEVPARYLTQTQVQMACLGVAATRLVALVAGELREYRIAFDKELADELCATADEWFRRHVVDGAPLEPDGSKAFSSFIASRFPKETGEVLTASAETSAAFAEWRKCKAQVEEFEARAAVAEQRVRMAVGVATEMHGDGWAVTLKEQERKSVDWKALCKSLGIEAATVEQFTKTNAFRVLRVKGVK